MKKLFVIIPLLLLLVQGCNKSGWKLEDGKLRNIENLSQLAQYSDFNFTIMAENEGFGLSSNNFSKLTTFSRENDTAFTIGAGVHLDGNKNPEFLNYIKDNNWWKTRFFPNISTYENEYYGTKYSDWNIGKKLIDQLKFKTYSKITYNGDSADYYVQIKEGFYTIHLFQLHNHEREGFDPEKSTTLKWLETEIEAIVKSNTDFIILSGRGLEEVLSQEIHSDNYQKILNKADLIISDDFDPFQLIGNELAPNGAAILNTGSLNSNSKYTPAGFVQVYHLNDPSALVILYLNAEEEEFRLPSEGRAFIKYVDGPLEKLKLRPLEETEMPERVVCTLPEEYSNLRMMSIAEKLFMSVYDCDKAWVTPESGLKSGEVLYKDLWDVFPKNGEIYILDLSYSQLRKIFGKEMFLDTHEGQCIAIGSYFGDFIIEKFNLSSDEVIKTGKYEIELLEQYLKDTNPPREQTVVQQ